jgi:hypothetical protein
MNEQILHKLKLEAGGSFYPDVNPDLQRKFAELIVAECQIALNPMLRDMISRGQAVDLIKKHFGLKD